MRSIAVFLFFGFLFSGCHPSGSEVSKTDGQHKGNTRYATRFELLPFEGFTLLRVFDPWQKSRGSTYTCVLGKDEALLPDSLSVFPFIQTPVSRVIAMSTTHVAMIAGLDEASSIKGASGTPFIYNPDIRKACDAGQVADVGYGQGINYEKVVSLEPDLVFLYGVEGNVISVAEKLEELGIQVVFCAEYLEQDPLGKAEWIRFFAAFYNREREADSIFSMVDSNYTSLQSLVSPVSHKPEVMTGLPWKDTWYVAGGKSYASRLIEEAGGSYIWRDNDSDEAVPMNLESVYTRAVDADIWINPGVARTIAELIAFDVRFEELPVLKQGRIYNNNARLSPGGGNDYWESATLRPDLVLADLISIFHPDLLKDHTLFYYRKLNYEDNR